MTEQDTTPRIWVASLSDYNAGTLHGKWIDATQDAEDIQAEVNAMLAESPEAKLCQVCGQAILDHPRAPLADGAHWVPFPGNAEEWAIHDYDNFGGIRLGEWESFEKISAIANAIEEHGAGAVRGYLDHRGDDADLGEFDDYYQGHYDSEKDFAYEFVAEFGWGIPDSQDWLEKVPEAIEPYLDWDAITRDMNFSGMFYFADAGAPEYGVYVFRGN